VAGDERRGRAVAPARRDPCAAADAVEPRGAGRLEVRAEDARAHRRAERALLGDHAQAALGDDVDALEDEAGEGRPGARPVERGDRDLGVVVVAGDVLVDEVRLRGRRKADLRARRPDGL